MSWGEATFYLTSDAAGTVLAAEGALAAGGKITGAIGSKLPKPGGGVKPPKPGEPSGGNPTKPSQAAETLRCFAAGTLVDCEGGLRPIESVEQGDRVWSFDLVRSEWRLCRVAKPYSIASDGTLVLVTIGGETTEATYQHPYWVVRGELLDFRPHPEHMAEVPRDATMLGRWVDSCDLLVGDEVLLRDGRVVPVERIAHRLFKGPVYNMEVEDIHCYSVGRRGVLVHNNNGSGTGPAKPAGAGPGPLEQGGAGKPGGGSFSGSGDVKIEPAGTASNEPLATMGRPPWTNRPGGFVNWLRNLQKEGTKLTKAEADAIIAECEGLGVYVRLDPPHPGLNWAVSHLNIRDSANVHLEAPQGYTHPTVPTGSANYPQ